MAATVKNEREVCVLCKSAESDLFLPEEYDAGAPRTLPPVKTMLLHLSHNKPLPEGRICGNCAQRAVDAYEFSTQISSNTTQPLSEKIRDLRKRLHQLTQRIDVFIVVGAGSEGGYQEDDIIMVQKDKLAAADEQQTTKWQHEEFQCSICPKSFKSGARLAAHAASHAGGARRVCWRCGAQLQSAAALHDHCAAHAPPPASTCQLCAHHFESERSLAEHEASCPAVCPVCGAACVSRGELAAHARDVHAGRLPTLCDRCFYVAHTEEARLAHVVQHRAGPHYVCGADGCVLRFRHRSVGTRSTRTRARNLGQAQAELQTSRVCTELEPSSPKAEAGPPSPDDEIAGHEEYLDMETFDDD